jgi:hypothetical protein
MNARDLSSAGLVAALRLFERHGFKAGTAQFLREELEAELAADECRPSSSGCTLCHDEGRHAIQDPP